MKMKIAFLNCISHGDCAVITFSENGKGRCIVVDGGEDKKAAGALTDHLRSENVRSIDLMIGTHIDQDHINGLKHFVNDQLKLKKDNKDYVPVLRYWGAKPSQELSADRVPSTAGLTGTPCEDFTWQDFVIQSVGQNDDLVEGLIELGTDLHYPSLEDLPSNPFENISLEVLGPDRQIAADQIKKKALGVKSSIELAKPILTWKDLEAAVASNFEAMAKQAKRNANNQSIVFRLKPIVGKAAGKKWSFLFTGDAEEEAWDFMVADPRSRNRLKSKVLKIPHHGSALNGITKTGAEKVNPDYSVNSVGQKHGLPDKGTLKLMKLQGCKILCTQRNSNSHHKSACYAVAAVRCPAKGKKKTICFIVDTTKGTCKITPKGRACKKAW
jgi:beta-lactamase superfamily II metal-dependent hydrolase